MHATESSDMLVTFYSMYIQYLSDLLAVLMGTARSFRELQKLQVGADTNQHRPRRKEFLNLTLTEMTFLNFVNTCLCLKV